MDPVIVVGLGNPGSEYEGTRHNIGFEVVDELTRRFKTSLKSGRGEYLFASRREFVLVKPLTYMNNSGTAVVEALERFESSISSLIIVADDFALPLGTIRIRTKGSDGGHNGLASIIYQLNSNEFARVRCGIQKEVMPPKHRMAEFVLSPFEPEERDKVKEMVVQAADAAVECAVSGIARAMTRFNTKA